jgi:hypothetical protein
MLQQERPVGILENAWAQREEVLYPRMFGKMSRGIFPLSTDDFGRISEGAIDPRWLHLGVFEYEPSSTRESWLYVTSGGSTPWEGCAEPIEEGAYSWLGVEFVLETHRQADWPIPTLKRLLAYHVLACCGRFGDSPVPDYGHRIPAGGPIDGKSSALRFLAICKPWHYEPTCQLPSGKFDFLHVVGISESERDLAKQSSTAALVERLRECNAAPVTDALRKPVASAT